MAGKFGESDDRWDTTDYVKAIAASYSLYSSWNRVKLKRMKTPHFGIEWYDLRRDKTTLLLPISGCLQRCHILWIMSKTLAKTNQNPVYSKRANELVELEFSSSSCLLQGKHFYSRLTDVP